MRRNRGFTLLELMIALVIGIVLLTLGVPSFNSSARQNCVVGGANAFLATLMQARSEAVSRAGPVSICKSADGASCARGAGVAWHQGYVMFTDADGNGVKAAGDIVIAAVAPALTCGTMKANSFGNYISYGADGRVNTNGSFFVYANGAAEVNRTIAVFVSRVRICSHDVEASCPPPP